MNLQTAQFIKLPKYIFKYIIKEHDKVNATIINKNDEIKHQLQCRYISPTQAI